MKEDNERLIFEYQNLIPKKYSEYYIENIKNDKVIYNPIGVPSITTMDSISFELFNLIDDKKSTCKLFNLIKIKFPQITLLQVCNVISLFFKNQIVYFFRPNNIFELNSNKPRSIEVWFHITNNCNLRCKYCYIYKTPLRMNRPIIKKAIKKIFKSAYDNGVSNVTIKFAGGEPFLELENVQYTIVQGNYWANKYHINAFYSIMTNGTLFTENNLKIITDNKIAICISVDGLEKSQDLNRQFADGTGSSIIVLKNIELLMKKNIEFVINSVVTYENVKYLKKWVLFLLNNRIRFGLSLERVPTFVDTIPKKDHQMFIKEMKKVYKAIYDNTPKYQIINRLLSVTNFDRPKLYACNMGSSYYMIKANGDITNCPMTANDTIGSINNKADIMDIIRKENPVRNIDVLKKTGCSHCIYRYSCAGQCPFQPYFYYRKYNLPSPMCYVYKNLIPELIKIEAIRQIKYQIQNQYITTEHRY